MATKSDLPSFEEYFVPLVAVLKARVGSATIEELEEGVAAEMKLSEDVRSVLHGDGPRTQFGHTRGPEAKYVLPCEPAPHRAISKPRATDPTGGMTLHRRSRDSAYWLLRRRPAARPAPWLDANDPGSLYALLECDQIHQDV